MSNMLGSIICNATPDEVCDTMLDWVDYHGSRSVRAAVENIRLEALHSEHVDIFDELCDLARALAPAGCYFGTRQGGRADWGVWPDERDEIVGLVYNAALAATVGAATVVLTDADDGSFDVLITDAESRVIYASTGLRGPAQAWGDVDYIRAAVSFASNADSAVEYLTQGAHTEHGLEIGLLACGEPMPCPEDGQPIVSWADGYDEVHACRSCGGMFDGEVFA